MRWLAALGVIVWLAVAAYVTLGERPLTPANALRTFAAEATNAPGARFGESAIQARVLAAGGDEQAARDVMRAALLDSGHHLLNIIGGLCLILVIAQLLRRPASREQGAR